MRSIKFGGKLIAAASFLAVSLSAAAQEDDGGPRTWGEDASYVSVTHIAFKPGQRESAMQIIAEHFVAATEKAGTAGPMLVIHYQTGKWDMAVVWNLEGGTADLEWNRSPDNVKWFEALAEIAGGADKADEIWSSYISKVADSTSQIGHYHTGEDSEE